MDSPSPPPAPDPQVTAAAQGAANIDAARVNTSLNRPDQYTPWGSQTWQNLGGDRWSSTVNVSPTAQRVIDSQIDTSWGLNNSTKNALGRVDSTMQQPLDFSAAGLVKDREKVADAMYSSYTRRLDPQFGQQEERMKSDLVNRGLMPGTEAYQTEWDNFSRSKNDAYGQARTAAELASTTEAERQASSMLRGRNQILNELSSLRTGQQVQAPQFQSGMSGANVGAAPYLQATQMGYNGQLNQYNAEVGANNATMGALGGLGAAGLGAWGTAAAGGAMMF